MNLRAMSLTMALALAACGSSKAASTPGADAHADAADVGTAPQDVAKDAPTVPSTLKWVVYPSGSTAKMRAIAADPSHPGSYVIAGASAHVWRLDGTELSEHSPTNIGSSNLRAAWVAADGTAFVAGEGNALLRQDGDAWALAEELPASPAVQFTGVCGASSKEVWAVGENAAAWRWDGSAWLPETVSVTESVDGALFGVNPSFSAVFVRGANDVWIAGGPGAASAGFVVHGTGSGAWKAWAVDQVPSALWVSEAVPSLGAKARVFVVGGSAEDYVAILDDKAFVRQDNKLLQWKQGFLGIGGASADLAWATSTKGQLRKYDHGTWSLDGIQSPVGTKPSEAISVAAIDLRAVAVLNADERAVLSDFKVFRWGMQPL